MLYKSFLKDQHVQKIKYSSYAELKETIRKRHDAYFKGEISGSHLNKTCLTDERSTDDNGDKLMCCICLGGAENEVCRLSCGHINFKTCIEGWFSVADDASNSVQQPRVAADERRLKVNRCPMCNHDCS